jgi:energy-coupling factor transporter transmembrane protein EcfT
MINEKSMQLERSAVSAPGKLGTLGYMSIFAWSLGMVMLAPAQHLLLAGGLCTLVAVVVYPRAFRRLMRLRWLVMIVLLALPPLFFLGDRDRSLWGIPYSSQGLVSSLQIILRVIVVLVAVDGFTSSVDIACIAGLFERFGLRGLGFSMGVALNLLPSLQMAAVNTWHSLWMRGGLRQQRLRGIRLLLLTIITNALRRTEEIALAAEGRAFCPEHCRAMPLRAGSLDRVVMAGAVILILGFFLIL